MGRIVKVVDMPNFGELTLEERNAISSKPLWRMRRFAALLGWNGLELRWLIVTEDEETPAGLATTSRLICYYETTEVEFKLQINESPAGQSLPYQAMVGPFRYGICAIGWHPFELFEDAGKLIAEAERLRPWLDRQQFRNPRRRAAFKKKHPELLLNRH